MPKIHEPKIPPLRITGLKRKRSEEIEEEAHLTDQPSLVHFYFNSVKNIILTHKTCDFEPVKQNRDKFSRNKKR